jgi:hypothetical protein
LLHRPISAAIAVQQQQQLVRQQQQQQAAVAAAAQRAPSVSPPQLQQYVESLQMLLSLCQQLDTGSTGAVPRAHLESWMQGHCRPLLGAVDAATILDLLLQHTYGEAAVLGVIGREDALFCCWPSST